MADGCRREREGLVQTIRVVRMCAAEVYMWLADEGGKRKNRAPSDSDASLLLRRPSTRHRRSIARPDASDGASAPPAHPSIHAANVALQFVFLMGVPRMPTTPPRQPRVCWRPFHASRPLSATPVLPPSLAPLPPLCVRRSRGDGRPSMN